MDIITQHISVFFSLTLEHESIAIARYRGYQKPDYSSSSVDNFKANFLIFITNMPIIDKDSNKSKKYQHYEYVYNFGQKACHGIWGRVNDWLKSWLECWFWEGYIGWATRWIRRWTTCRPRWWKWWRNNWWNVWRIKGWTPWRFSWSKSWDTDRWCWWNSIHITLIDLCFVLQGALHNNNKIKQMWNGNG